MKHPVLNQARVDNSPRLSRCTKLTLVDFHVHLMRIKDFHCSAFFFQTSNTITKQGLCEIQIPREFILLLSGRHELCILVGIFPFSSQMN